MLHRRKAAAYECVGCGKTICDDDHPKRQMGFLISGSLMRRIRRALVQSGEVPSHSDVDDAESLAKMVASGEVPS
jgi:hypothetical protein